MPYRRVDDAHRSRRRYWRKHHGPVGERTRSSTRTGTWRPRSSRGSSASSRAVPPGMAREWDAAVFAYNARAALGRTPGVGMREAAEEFNRARPADNRA